MAEQSTPNPAFSSTDPLLNRFFLTPEQKKDKARGKEILKAIYTQQTSDSTNLNFFRGRNARWIQLLLWAKGAQKMDEFLDFMSVSDGNRAYVNLDMTPQRLATQFVGTLTESMSKNKTYPCVNAIDDGSLNEKEQRKLDALFRMHEVETIQQVQQDFGVEVEPPNAFVPDDEISAQVYFELEDRLPKEIRFEKMLEMVRDSIHFEKVLNRKGIYDMVVINFEATKIEKVAVGKYTARKCVPSNMVYNFFMNDTGECEVTMVGEFYNLKVKDYRRKFGKSDMNPDGLSEKEIFELAKLSTNKHNIGQFNYSWQDTWSSMGIYYNRPYDDCSILVFDCEVNCGEDVYFVSKKDNFGKDNIQAKKNVPYQQTTKDGRVIEQPKPDDVDIIKRQKNAWMRGVYAPYGDKMLYWGQPDIIITPYTDVYNPLSSYTINIPNNDGEYVPSLFERIMEPLKEYSIAKLKRKQLIAKLRPSGYKVDVESARNLDLGNGDTIAWEETVRIADQTGVELWSSKGVNPNENAAPPISPATADNAIEKIIGLTATLHEIVAEIRALIGVPIYRDGSDVGDRTAARLAEGQNQSSYNVTDFILNGHNQLWEETYYKLCLLHWNDIVKTEPETKEDMLNTRFAVSVKMKSSEYEKELLEKDIDRYSQIVDKEGNPALSPRDVMMIREIDNPKMARKYLTDVFNDNIRRAEERSAKLQQQNAQVQNSAIEMSAKHEMEQLQLKLKMDEELKNVESREKKEQIMLQGVFDIYKLILTPVPPAGEGKKAPKQPQMPPELQALATLVFQNVAIPMLQENKQQKQEVVAGAIQEKMMQQAAMQQQAPQQ